jgi:hypothetical protein
MLIERKERCVTGTGFEQGHLMMWAVSQRLCAKASGAILC